MNKEEFEHIQKKYSELEEKFEKAYQHCKELFEEYLMIGSAGMFGAPILKDYLTRYENGERTYQLFKDMSESE